MAPTVCVFVALFAAFFGVAYWLTPFRPFATIQLGEANSILHYSFSPDGSKLLALASGSSSEPRPRLWDVKTGRLRRTFDRRGSFATACFSPDGRWVLVIDETAAGTVWDVETGELACTLRYGPLSRDHANFPYFTGDGRFLVSWRLTQDGVYRYSFHPVGIWNTAFEIDGLRIELSRDGKSFVTEIVGREETESKFWRLEDKPILLKSHLVATRPYVRYSSDLTLFAAREIDVDGKQRVVIRETATGRERWSDSDPTIGDLVALTAEGKLLVAESHRAPYRTIAWQTPAGWRSSNGAFASANGEWLAGVTDASIRLTRVDDGANFDVSPDDVDQLWMSRIGTPTLFSPDSKFLLLNSTPKANVPRLKKWLPDGWKPFGVRPRRWDLSIRALGTLHEVAVLTSAWDAHFSPDGSILGVHRINENGSAQEFDLYAFPPRIDPWLPLGWATLACSIAAAFWWSWSRK